MQARGEGGRLCREPGHKDRRGAPGARRSMAGWVADLAQGNFN